MHLTCAGLISRIGSLAILPPRCRRSDPGPQYALFTRVRGMGILGSSYPRSCIAPPPCPKPSLALTSAVLAHNIRRYGHPLAGGLGQSGRTDAPCSVGLTGKLHSRRSSLQTRRKVSKSREKTARALKIHWGFISH